MICTSVIPCLSSGLAKIDKIMSMFVLVSRLFGHFDRLVIFKTFSTKNHVFVEKLWLFGSFSGDKGDYIDVWMIKIMIKTNQIDMDVCFFQK